MPYLNYNGDILFDTQVCISPESRAFRYGDGFFETIRLIDSRIALEKYHLERLYSSLELLKFDLSSFPASSAIVEQILQLAKKNGVSSSARIRVTVFAVEGSLYNTNRKADYIIHTYPLSDHGYSYNNKGATVGFYREATKSWDVFSAVKSNNFMPYAMGSIWAKENKLDDAILLNPYGNIADATIANVFIVKDGLVKTPSISDGPVGGVMRKYLLKCMRDEGIPVQETSLNAEEVLEASEVFLTNAIIGIKWVSKIGQSNFTNLLSNMLYQKFLSHTPQ